MKKKSLSSLFEENSFTVSGTIRNYQKQPVPNALVQVYSKGIREMQLLGEASTDDMGVYAITYNTKQVTVTSIIVQVYDAQKSLLKETGELSNIQALMLVDIELDARQTESIPAFERLVQTISPFIEDIPLTQLTEGNKHRDISFISKKTGLAQGTVEKVAMAFRFETLSSLPAQIWFGLLCTYPADPAKNENPGRSGQRNFETRLDACFDALMHTSLEASMNNLQKAIDQNIISITVVAQLPDLKDQLEKQVMAFAKQHPVSGEPSALYKKASMGGLKGEELPAFIEAYNNHKGSEEKLWKQLGDHAGFSDSKNLDQVQAVFKLSRLTENELPLTEGLIKSAKIKTLADVRKMAENTSGDWEELVKKHNVELRADAPGKNQTEKIKKFAAQLESNFTREFPTAAFTARLKKDSKSKLPHRDKISKFLQENEHFDLLHSKVGQFVKENKTAAAEEETPELERQLRRIQRVFKLSPRYETANALLKDNIHSAQQVFKMGKDNFVKTYGEQIGEKEAEQVFLKADDIFASALALTGDLQSMADASSLNAFPNFAQSIQTLSQELPNIETLFGHTDFFDTTESRSVYGAPAYLTDILHFLDNRLSTLEPALINGTTDTKRPTVKDLLLRRRPDMADIDLEEKNTNTEVPYIDIACEIMEDFIAPPKVSLSFSTFGANLNQTTVTQPLNATLKQAIKDAFITAGLQNIADLLAFNTSISAKYTTTRLQDDNTYLTQTNWIIRDIRIALKLSYVTGAANFDVRVLHQAFSSADGVSAGSEYVNTKVYANFLNTATRPFSIPSLPFDLFETEAGLYLEKMGTTKSAIINTFRHNSAPGVSTFDLNAAYAFLGINAAEQNLIFTADPTHQSLYWGDSATATSIQVDVFEKITGLNYNQINDLAKISFINPSADLRIEHDDLLADTSKQRIINITPTKLDAIHRFLRLWRKTNFTIIELGFVIRAINGNLINSNLPSKLQHFISLQQTLQLDPFQLGAFYFGVDTEHFPNSYFHKVFQNSSITNPINPRLHQNFIQASQVVMNARDKADLCLIAQISLNEFTDLLVQTSTTEITSFSSVKIIHNYPLFARSLGISLGDLLTFKKLIGVDPFLSQSPAATSQFIEKLRLIQSSGFNIDDLNYVLRHQNNVDGTLIPTTDQRSAALSQLQNDLLIIKTATTPAVDPNGVLLTRWLSDPVLKWDISILNRLMDILTTVDDDAYRQKITDNTNFLLNLRMQYHDSVPTADLSVLPITIPAFIAAQLSFDADKKQLILKGFMSDADRTALLALSADSAYQAAINSLFTKAALTSSLSGNIFFISLSDVGTRLNNLLSANIADRFAFFINNLSQSGVYRRLLQWDALTKHISTWFNIDKNLVTVLLTNVGEVFNDFTTNNFVNKIIDPTISGNPYPVQANRYQFLAKTFFVFNKLNISPLAQEHALRFFFTSGPARMGSLDFKALPLVAVGGSVSTYPGFEALLNLRRFDQLLPVRILPFTAGGAGTYDIYGQLIALGNLLPTGVVTEIPGALTQFASNLAFAYGWSPTDLQTLLTLNFTGLVDFQGASAIMLRLHNCFAMMEQLGVSLAEVQQWCLTPLTSLDTAKIKRALKLKYSDSDWVQAIKPLQDILREKKRDALIAYLLANPGLQSWKDSNDLYSHFLLDVEMSSCQPTSRIVQATNSVQLFVQRCFMGLEDSIVVKTKQDSNLEVSPDSNWMQWKWMKNFRVWQANVKVFLYPENWIEPELLPNEIKSPFLKELETELLQNEVTAINAENAFHSYLEKLDAVSRLEVKGMWYDQPSETLHVFARTYGGNPRIYYHRELINDRRWTPWKKIDLDITGDHIVPAVYNNRLYLFWAVFTEQAGEISSSLTIPAPNQNGTYTIPVGAPSKSWQIQLAFSEYKNGKWAAKKISENNDSGQIVVDQINHPDKSKFLFTPLDIPSYDYSQIFDVNHVQIDTLDEFARKIGPSLRQNGKLLISCYYYDYVADDSFDNCQYVGSFQLDPVKGHPTPLTVNYQVKPIQANRHIERSNRQSRMVNMLDVETFPNPVSLPPPTNGLPGSGTGGEVLVSDQAGGAFGNLIPMQMDLNDRLNYMLNIYFNTFNGIQFQLQLAPNLPYFYQDQKRSYYVVNEYTDNGSIEFLYSDFLKATYTLLDEGAAAYGNLLAQIPVPHDFFISRYFNFHHPLVDYFTQRLFVNGIDGLMDRDTQLKGDIGYDTDPNKFDFESYFQPVIQGFETIYSGANLPPVLHNGVPDPKPGYPKDDVDFNLQSGYGLYNWELFFHAPLMIAERLSQNQQFEDADRWYRYIFNPMDTSTHEAPNKFWNTKPFFFNTSTDYVNQRIDNILKGINDGQLNLEKDVEDWRKNPFQPHFIAQFRTVAYQKAAVMKYVGHLVRHGDFLFSQQSRESVNEATQLYILAAEILGPKPEVIPSVGQTGVDNFSQLEQKLDAFSDALVDVENLLTKHTIVGYNGLTPISPDLPVLQTMYFGVPMNENLAGPTGYWDVVADRLFKIRHCLDIDGNLAPLSLFSAPIDPGMLVRASAAGLDIGAILNDVNAPLPLYRFMVMMQKATELCNEVKSLGGALLSVLEKKDAEAMALLRSGQEIKLLGAILSIREKQIEDAQSTLENLSKQKDLVAIRLKYYSDLFQKGLNSGEKIALDKVRESLFNEGIASVGHLLAGVASLVPNFTAGVSGLGSPVATATFGGPFVGAATELGAKAFSMKASIGDKSASVMNLRSGYIRRSEEWAYQVSLANKDLEQIGKQIEGAQIRLEMAKQDLLNQQLQIDQSNETNDFMRSKFTSEELFNWMSTQLSNTYFKSYQLTYDVAKKAERCFRYELGLSDSAFINFGYWDSLKKGLLAGELLSYDIRKMELAYLDQNKRELELTKPISLSQLDPVALLKLKTTGECFINLPEELFDMDYPGHYMRRIKSVSITIPCITGPYTTVSCKLTMTKNSVRISGIASDATQYPRKLSNGVPTDDPRFRDAVGAIQSIATSSAQNDSGLFELNFRDERYLPFEGAGAISLWHLELPAAIRQFDYDTISDAIISLKYTARDGGNALKANAADSLNATINNMLVSLQDKGLMRIFSAKNDLATEWYRFLHPANATDDQVLTLNLDKSRFPLFVQGKTVKITSVELIADTAEAINNLQVIAPATAATPVNLAAGGYGSWKNGTADYASAKKDIGTWLIKNPVSNTRLTDTTLDNMVVIVHYEIS